MYGKFVTRCSSFVSRKERKKRLKRLKILEIWRPERRILCFV